MSVELHRLVDIQETHSAQNMRVVDIEKHVEQSWQYIAPYWSLNSLIAINPLKGFESLPFETAIQEGARLFQTNDFPVSMGDVNRQTIKWCQVLLDEGQATLSLPNKQNGVYQAWLEAIQFDKSLHNNSDSNKKWLISLPSNPKSVITLCLFKLNIPQKHWTLFLKVMLTTLPGWASYIQYLNNWCTNGTTPKRLSREEYLAVRLVLTSIIYPNALELISWYLKTQDKQYYSKKFFSDLEQREKQYCDRVLQLIENKQSNSESQPEVNAQFVFCIDVRSEPMRRAIESIGAYQTFGMAGFFGMTVSITNDITYQSRNSCPVLVKPEYQIQEKHCPDNSKKIERLGLIKRICKSLKYSFTTPFALAESTGFLYGGLLCAKTLFPKTAHHFSQEFFKSPEHTESVEVSHHSIPMAQKVNYATSVLRSIGLTDGFAKVVVFCGHHSTNINNAFNSALQCGACGGNSGATNAQLISQILNEIEVRKELVQHGIHIPTDTLFLGASHNTTTDKVSLYPDQTHNQPTISSQIQTLVNDLQKAQQINARYRSESLNKKTCSIKSVNYAKQNACDWAQIRPEWGLAKNSSFIIGPRTLTQNLDLGGRAFLHSYDYQQDEENKILESIITAPVVVAFWINTQYFFSTLDNVAFGAGSKVTKNITGKLGVMQGNASDLMHGLPLQSVFKSHNDAYHELLRLQVLVSAPLESIQDVLRKNSDIESLCRHGWIKLICLDPIKQKVFKLSRSNQWLEFSNGFYSRVLN